MVAKGTSVVHIKPTRNYVICSHLGLVVFIASSINAFNNYEEQALATQLDKLIRVKGGQGKSNKCIYNDN